MFVLMLAIYLEYTYPGPHVWELSAHKLLSISAAPRNFHMRCKYWSQGILILHQAILILHQAILILH